MLNIMPNNINKPIALSINDICTILELDNYNWIISENKNIHSSSYLANYISPTAPRKESSSKKNIISTQSEYTESKAIALTASNITELQKLIHNDKKFNIIYPERKDWFFSSHDTLTNEYDILVIFPYRYENLLSIVSHFFQLAGLINFKIGFCFFSPAKNIPSALNEKQQMITLSFAERLIDLTKPSVILTLGSNIYKLLTNQEFKNTQLNKPYKEKITLFPSYVAQKRHELEHLWSTIINIKSFIKKGE